MKRYNYYKNIFILFLLAGCYSAIAQNKPTSGGRPVVQPVTPPSAYTSPVINFVRTWEPDMPSSDPAIIANPARSVQEVKQETQYIDGLGRPIQKVSKGTSSKGYDVVSPVVYDVFGREQYQYLPYTQQESNGKFKTDPFNNQRLFYQDPMLNPGAVGESVYYHETLFEASPLNRSLKEYGPGNNWASNGGNRPMEQQYLANTAADNVRIWDIPSTGIVPVGTKSYRAGKLIKNLTRDENGLDKIEFRDVDGRLILKKSALVKGAADGHDNWLCTYYVYDILGNLCCVIPPKAVELIKSNWTLSGDIPGELCYFYRYDYRNRLIIKKMPGADSTELVYDKRDRIIAVRDGNLRKKTQQWMLTFYDDLNRAVMTALYNEPADRASLQSRIDGSSTGTGSVEYSFPSTRDLVVSSHDGRTAYTATNSIEFLNGFETADQSEMLAEIAPAANNGKTVLNVTNPLPAIDPAKLSPLTYTFYDNYNFTGAQTLVAADLQEVKSDDPYAERPTSATTMTNGLVTGGKVRVVGTDQWLTVTMYYDNKGRLIQGIRDNTSGGKNITSNLYNFKGNLLSTHLRHKNMRSATVKDLAVLTKFVYSPAGRIKQIIKRINNDPNTEHIVAESDYTEQGMLKSKKLDVKANSTLDVINYDYNIRGWLTGINKDYVNAGTGTNWFGEELNYDNGFTKNQFNGNVAGVKWKSRSDAIPRAFGYDYDAVNRLVKADFSEQPSAGAAWGNAVKDFSVGGLSYDPNGNMITMSQNGMDGTTKVSVDQLTYSYKPQSNKLTRVADGSPLSTKLGDFKNGTVVEDYYDYDANGNVTKETNKDIASIDYNHMNLPQVITFKNKGSITYLYDAVGSKLRKTTVDNTSGGKVTVTDYDGGFIYQQDTLLYFAHDEGRVRLVYQSGQAPVYAYDYFEKDHSGNVRMVLTENTAISTYAATMETPVAAKENALFSNVDNTRSTAPAGYPGKTNTNVSVAKLNAGNGAKVGPSLVLRVMAGDTIQVGAQAFYKSTAVNKNSSSNEEIVTSLLQALGGNALQSGTHGSAAADQSALGTGFNSGVYQRLKEKDPSQNKPENPRAYLSYALFDDQFKLVDDNSGVKQVAATPDELQPLASGKIVAKKTGFFYVFTTNEENRDMYFDNVVVTHAAGPLLEETHYYPFGLAMAAISNNALRGSTYPENKRKFNGNELESGELSDGGGLDLYDFNTRSYDHQLGRFMQIDPLAEVHQDYTPYHFALNNPILFSDPFGMDTTRGTTAPPNPQPGDVVVVPGANGAESFYTYDKNQGWIGTGMTGGVLNGITVTPNGSYTTYRTYTASIMDGKDVSGQDIINFTIAGVSLVTTQLQTWLMKEKEQILKSRLGTQAMKKALYTVNKGLTGVDKVSKKLGIAGAILTVGNLGYKYAWKGDGITRKDLFDAALGVTLCIVSISNPVALVALGVYGVLDATGALDGLKAAVGLDDTEVISAPSQPVLRNMVQSW
ncbi:MAG TPA: DUF6443 domain-containing protein [Chitinophaga sp.]|uniref:DUF6443 domain-containing protein n=1 Tax=Chitinophaga sp. TaxID=1869181 RepID=UPI002C8774B5|nr:DUF6443 domain-containing protein [Chitinophaga sp.]HVI44428.1 DUF6443 domain-containing protein [Chitinophaga sp.]